MLAVMAILRAVNRAVGRVGCQLAGAFLAVMTLTVMIQVVMRYGVGESPIWTAELSRTLMVWTAFMIAPWAYRERANVAVTLLVEALPATAQRVIALLIDLLIFWIVIVFLIESVDFVARGFANRAAALPVSAGVLYLIVPVGLLALALAVAERLLGRLPGIPASASARS